MNRFVLRIFVVLFWTAAASAFNMALALSWPLTMKEWSYAGIVVLASGIAMCVSLGCITGAGKAKSIADISERAIADRLADAQKCLLKHVYTYAKLGRTSATLWAFEDHCDDANLLTRLLAMMQLVDGLLVYPNDNKQWFNIYWGPHYDAERRGIRCPVCRVPSHAPTKEVAT